MEINLVKTKKGHKETLKRIRELMEIDEIIITEEQSDELEILSILAENYEDKTSKIENVDPISVIKFRIEQANYSEEEINKVFGNFHNMNYILSERHPLTLFLIKKLHFYWGIPLESLIINDLKDGITENNI